MNPRLAVVLTLTVAGLFGIIDVYFHSKGVPTPRPFDLALSITTMVVSYLWYRNDARAYGFNGSVAFGGLIILLSIIGIPIYLAKTRPAGTRLKSVASFIGLLVAAFAIMAVTTSIAEAAIGA